MSSLPSPTFSFQGHTLRIKSDEQGEPLFHAGDLCAILGYVNPREAVRRHVYEEDVVKRDTLTAGGRQLVNFVREPSLDEVPYPVKMEPNLVVEFYSR